MASVHTELPRPRVLTKRILPLALALTCVALPACNKAEDHHEPDSHHKIVTTSPVVKDVVLTQEYVCLIHSRRHIKIQALAGGYLQEVRANEGQDVKKGDLLFQIMPVLYKAKLDAEVAEAKLAEQELNNAKRLLADRVVSDREVALYQAKLSKAEAKVTLAEAELNFASVKAPFDGKVDRLHEQVGSLIKEGDVLTTLSDNSVMWVYFNVPESRYLDYMVNQGRGDSADIGLVLANGSKFRHHGRIATIEAMFNKETGNIPFRADFPNPERLLRHGQTGTVQIERTVKDAVVIPQRATFEILDKRYVWVVEKGGVVRQREVAVEHEKDDIFILRKGLGANDRIIIEGVRQVRDGQNLEEPEHRSPESVLGQMKYHAE